MTKGKQAEASEAAELFVAMLDGVGLGGMSIRDSGKLYRAMSTVVPEFDKRLVEKKALIKAGSL